MALAGREILFVEGDASRGFIVTFRGDRGEMCKALVPPSPDHSDYRIAEAHGVSGKSSENSFWRR